MLALNIAQHEPQYLSEFQRSTATNLTSFVVDDMLLATMNHLWLIGPVLNLLVGLVGGAIGVAIAKRRAGVQAV